MTIGMAFIPAVYIAVLQGVLTGFLQALLFFAPGLALIALGIFLHHLANRPAAPAVNPA
jgi:hypothetical protein